VDGEKDPLSSRRRFIQSFPKAEEKNTFPEKAGASPSKSTPLARRKQEEIHPFSCPSSSFQG